ncbi:hypothetical protein METBIDRAFT_76838 [Metschnikowia bicuspidata var. bicuspidata NRRL YB-4993]|uniref:AFG1-like ATPase n=1 Tax=Metschnikowia bicuspidata var. bicuspidata NRRL YB-4993 TaxID=869754 RepID=A0A1A0HIT6_9ASCO|nr:hypothetical protein METBIDRAFT_76838 [Metschnikowia bicuspidata var. bicuspidata NRRL YB-4993]OBA23916.1 hypothetical protein METBIDRAFT_76838 [Metschnikowia bicuspidata var. bicuspidata NRRL YB-4993]
MRSPFKKVIYCRIRLYSNTTKGIQGFEGRTPTTLFTCDQEEREALTTTDPFLVYKSYISLGKLIKDEYQLRVMKEFQKLYNRLIDYKPHSAMPVKQALLLRKLEIAQAKEKLEIESLTHAPIHKFKKWFQKDADVQKMEIVKHMTDEEELHGMYSPQGLLVHGEVGCGKSMLMDIFASSLPHDSKMRWHYNSFILWVFGEIHKIQKERMLTESVSLKRKFTMENEFILFEIAQKMIDKSTIFMLDEFMLPDIAAAQIIRILFVHYFKLGGVLIATSNKLPEELYSSEFNKSKFNSFVGLLHNRCVSVDMRSSMDYRKHFAQMSPGEKNLIVKKNNPIHQVQWNDLLRRKAVGSSVSVDNLNSDVKELNWEAAEICVYNRKSVIPKTLNGSLCWVDFNYICGGSFSSSDYITLASKFKIFIVDDVPVMNTKKKNEARRFITLVDALYEARCQLFLRCSVSPEEIFFPSESMDQTDNETVQQEEMYAKTSMQTLNPYRPNVSSYDQAYAKVYEHEGKDTNENFGNLKAFTGEDEKFAYKRAVSRIHEMVASDHWRSSDRWLPIDQSMRPWERSNGLHPVTKRGNFDPDVEFLVLPRDLKDIKETLKVSMPRDVSAKLSIPFRQFNEKISPEFFNMLHFWGLGEWTIDQQKKIKDKIAHSWVSGGIRRK